MAGFVVKNNAESLVADNPLASGATTLNVTSGEGDNFPSTFPYRLTIWDDEAHADPTDDPEMEIVECTDRTGDALEIVRGKEGTSDVEHANGERVAMLITAGLFNDSVQGIQSQIDKHLEIIRQMHPNVSVLGGISSYTADKLCIVNDKLTLDYVGFDGHDDNSLDTTIWSKSSTGTVEEQNSEYLFLDAQVDGTGSSAEVTSDVIPSSKAGWYCEIKDTTEYSCHNYIILIGNSTHTYTLPADGIKHTYVIKVEDGNVNIYKDGSTTPDYTDPETDSTVQIKYEASSNNHLKHSKMWVYVTTAFDPQTTNDITTDALAANADVLSFYSHLKGKFSNGDSTASDPVEVEIYGNGDSYASPLNGTTKLKIDPSDPIIELYRIDDSVAAKSDAQTDWVLDDNSTNGVFTAKTTSTHETILAEEIGCASVVMVEKSVNGDFTDAEILIEDDDYTVDYSTRTATKIILTTSAASDIVNSQSKLRITWIVDVENIDGTANTALKMKIYLNRTDTTEASPEIQPIDLGTSQYAEMKYMCG